MNRTKLTTAFGVMLLCTNLIMADAAPGVQAEGTAISAAGDLSPPTSSQAASTNQPVPPSVTPYRMMSTEVVQPWASTTRVRLPGQAPAVRDAVPAEEHRAQQAAAASAGGRDGEECEHRIDLSNCAGLGIGWLGSTVDVLVNGDVVLSQITLPVGDGPEPHYFMAATGDTITTVYNAGGNAYSFTNYYQVYDGFGVLLAEDGITSGSCYAEPVGVSAGANCELPSTGACCYDDQGSCEVLTLEECTTNGGTFLGPLTECHECPCDLVCPVGGIPENEVCGEVVNDGCAALGYPFGSTVSCGDTICGTTWTDTDSWWYDFDFFEITLDEPQILTWTVKSEISQEVQIYRTGVLGECANNKLWSLASELADYDCTEMTVTAEGIEGGTYWLYVGPYRNFGEPCDQDYVATLTCEPVAAQGACCLPDASCSVTSELSCTTWGGTYQGDAVTCESVTCEPFYCPASGTMDVWGYIGLVKIGGINNSSGWDAYADYTHLSTDVAVGSSERLTVLNPEPLPDPAVCKAWVDWNQDLDFDDPGEASELVAGDGPLHIPITAPLDALSGPTRLRVRMDFDTDSIDPCGDTVYVEVEDYTLNVVELEGACCDPIEGTCTTGLPSTCDGTYGGAGTTCAGTDCNSNGVDDTCDIVGGYSTDCNQNGLPDDCEVLIDCNSNGVLDECDILAGTSADCNGNTVPDECDVDAGTSQDCQDDGTPDECQVLGEAAFLWDDGTSESAVGRSLGGYNAWINHFTTEAHQTTITQVRLAYGLVAEGTPVTVCVWEDPDQDGHPIDAQVLALVSTTVVNADRDIFNIVDVPDVTIEGVGAHFFVGAIIQHEPGEYPSPMDNTTDMGHSWLCGDNNTPIDPHHLDLAAVPPTSPANYGFVGNWLIRADALVDGDCNNNGYPDDCDVPPVCEGPGCSADCNGNLQPDECEPDCNENGVPDDCDLTDCTPGEAWCADCNSNSLPDECDLPPYGDEVDCQPNGIPDVCEGPDCNENGVPDECDLRDCDGSGWCDDCNENGTLDSCDLGFSGEYQYDDGTVEDALGIGTWAELVWIQRFTAEPGFEIITAVATMFGAPGSPGSSGVAPGDPIRVFVWDDPVGDGNPMTAVFLAGATAPADATAIDTGVFQEVPIGPVHVSGSFLVGAAAITPRFPMPMDVDGELAHESWLTYALLGTGGFDPTAIPGAEYMDYVYPCNWALRAITAAPPAGDCNENGTLDECELCGDLDGDEEVDYDDYVIFLAAFGGVADGSPLEDYCCDYDSSGAVGMADYAAWLDCYRDYIGEPTAGPPEKPWWNKRPGIEPVGGGQGIQKVPSVRP